METSGEQWFEVSYHGNLFGNDSISSNCMGREVRFNAPFFLKGTEKIVDPWTHSSLRKPCTSHHIKYFFARSRCLRLFYGSACEAMIDSSLFF